MKASAVALSPPAISSTTPRSHVNKETNQISLIGKESMSQTEPNDLGWGRTEHGRKYYTGRGDDMSTFGEWLTLEEILFDHFTTNVILQRYYRRQSSNHHPIP